MTNPTEHLPLAARPAEDVPGHWLLARLGKRVLRPGGAGLTRDLLARTRIAGADVVELAPGLGRTAAQIVAAGPASYTGVERDADAVRIVEGSWPGVVGASRPTRRARGCPMPARTWSSARRCSRCSPTAASRRS